MIPQAEEPNAARTTGSLVGLAVGSAYPAGLATASASEAAHLGKAGLSDQAILAIEIAESFAAYGEMANPFDLRARFERQAEHWVLTDELGDACSTLGYLAPLTICTPPGSMTIANALILLVATDELDDCSDEVAYFAAMLASAQWAPAPSELPAADLKKAVLALDPSSALWGLPDHPWNELVTRLRRHPWRAADGEDLGHPDEFVSTLEAALWALDTTDSFEAGLELAASGGENLSLRCAIYGQLAGAIYGIDAIPQEWLTAAVGLLSAVEQATPT